MSYRPRIFISHSAKEPEAKSLCRAVADELIHAEFDVLWDQNLQTSQAWRSVVDEWIWRCDGAVLVLSQAATESRYVAYEAALLRQRWKNAAGQFLLIPIWCPGVTHAILTDRMGALQLSEIQTNIRLDGWPLGAPNVPSAFNDVCRQAVARLTTLQASIQARHDVEDLLIKQLNLGTPNEEALREIATQYNLAPMPTGSKKDLAAALAGGEPALPGVPLPTVRSAGVAGQVARRPGRSRRRRARGWGTNGWARACTSTRPR